MTGRHILAIDQGTTSTRFVVFDRAGTIVGSGTIVTEPRPVSGFTALDLRAFGLVEVQPVVRCLGAVEHVHCLLPLVGIGDRDVLFLVLVPDLRHAHLGGDDRFRGHAACPRSRERSAGHSWPSGALVRLCRAVPEGLRGRQLTLGVARGN